MRGKKTVVIFTDNSSRNTSAAIKEAFREDKEVLTIIIAEKELDSYIKSTLHNFIFKEESKIANCYNKLSELQKARKLNKLPPQKVSFNMKSILHRRVQNVFLRYKPDIVIAMTSKVLIPSLAVRDKLHAKTKVVVVLDEFTLNKQLVHKAVDYYFVENATIEKQLLSLGIASASIKQNNIPIRLHIQKELSQEEGWKTFDFSPKTTILIIASKLGDERFRKVINAVYQRKYDANVIVACGYNKRLLAYVREKTNFLGLNEGIDLNSAYSCADIVIARPTATVLMESLYKKKLIFSLFPSGEMEKRTLNYLNKDLLIKANDEQNLVDKLDAYMADNDHYIGVQEEVKMYVSEEPTQSLSTQLEEIMSGDEVPVN